MTQPVPLSPYRLRHLDHIARCPSCGEWTYWADSAHNLAAELDPTHCHHGTDTHQHLGAAS